MADTLTTKKVTELTENTAMSDEDLFMVGSAGTASLRRLKWSNIWNTIKTAILGKLVANNLTTTAAGYLLDARQGKALDDKISKLNTDLNNVVFEGGIFGTNAKFYKIGDRGIIFSLRGSLSQALTPGTVYEISMPEMVGAFAGSFIASNGVIGYIITEDGKIKIYVMSTMSGWILASGVLTYGA